MRKQLITFLACLFLAGLSTAQSRLNDSDKKVIRDGAMTLVEHFAAVLNIIGDPTSTASAIQSARDKVLYGDNRIFDNPEVIIENDLNQALAEKGGSNGLTDCSIDTYLTQFGLILKGSSYNIVTFSDIITGPISESKKEIMVNVYYRSKINVTDPAGMPYGTVNRYAIVRADRVNNEWKKFIVGIRLCESNVEVKSDRVEKDYANFTESIYPDRYELQFKNQFRDRREIMYDDHTEIYYDNTVVQLKQGRIIVNDPETGYSFTDLPDSLKMTYGNHLTITADKKSPFVSCSNTTKSVIMDDKRTAVRMKNRKSASVYDHKVEASYRGIVKTIYFTFPDSNMVLIDGGSFRMGPPAVTPPGAESPAIEVNDFYMDRHEVTYRQFKAFMDANPDYRTEAERQGFSYIYNKKGEPVRRDTVNWKYNEKGEKVKSGEWDKPVLFITWNDANEYCKWIGKRLPTEAEWEYAARGGALEQSNDFGKDFKPGDAGWYSGNADGQLHVAGQKPPNRQGLQDMIGNVAEWCSDGIDQDNMTLKGGSWISKAEECTPFYRKQERKGTHNAAFGFRCAMDVPAQ